MAALIPLLTRRRRMAVPSLSRRSQRRSLPLVLSRKQLSTSLCRELRRELCRINTSRKVGLTIQQSSLDTDFIARKPASAVKFQVSRTAGCAALAGYIRSETCLGRIDRSSGTFLARNPAPEAKFQVSQAPGALRLAGSNRDETSPCGLLDESNLTFQQNSLDIDSIARKPAPEAKFQVSPAPGCADACRIYQG